MKRLVILAAVVLAASSGCSSARAGASSPIYGPSVPPDGSITTPKLAANAVTSAKLANGAVGTTQIASSAVTDAKVNDVAWSKLTGTTAAGGDLGGNYPNPLVVALQGVPVSNATPTAGEVIEWDSFSGDWIFAQVTDAAVSAGASIARSKLAIGAAYQVVTNDSGGVLSGVAPGTSGHLLTSDGTQWTSAAPATSGTVTSVAAGTGLSASPSPVIGTGTISLANTAVTPASYTNTSLTVDQQGRITAASSGTAPVTTVSGTSPITSSGGTTPAISLNDTAVSPASYGDATHVGGFTVDQQGRLTAASSTSIALPVSALTGFGAVNHFICSTGSVWSPCFASGDGTFDGTGALTLKSVGTASTYGDASHVAAVTTDAQGRVSAASSTLIAIAASQVTSGLATIATTGALTDGTGTLLVSHGGWGLATLTAHALYVGNGTSAPTAVGLGTTTKVLHGAAAGDPTFSAVALGADVSGTLPTGNGGIGSDTSATSGYPVWASGVVSFNNAATTLAALGGAPTGGVAGAWLAAGVGGTLTTGFITGSYRTVSNTGKFRNVTCDLGSAGSGSSSAITAKITNVTDSTDLCSGTLMACNSATQAQFDCNASFLAGKNYRLNITAQPCGTGGSGIVCNIEVAQP